MKHAFCAIFIFQTRSRATTWYGKGYVIYTDKTGEEHTLYSDVVPCEVIR